MFSRAISLDEADRDRVLMEVADHVYAYSDFQLSPLDDDEIPRRLRDGLDLWLALRAAAAGQAIDVPVEATERLLGDIIQGCDADLVQKHEELQLPREHLLVGPDRTASEAEHAEWLAETRRYIDEDLDTRSLCVRMLQQIGPGVACRSGQAASVSD